MKSFAKGGVKSFFIGSVIPAKAGIQSFIQLLDSRLRGSDELEIWYEFSPTEAVRMEIQDAAHDIQLRKKPGGFRFAIAAMRRECRLPADSSNLKIVFSPNPPPISLRRTSIGVDASSQVLDILEYALQEYFLRGVCGIAPTFDGLIRWEVPLYGKTQPRLDLERKSKF